MANRMPHPIVTEILGMASPVHPDLPNLVIRLEDEQDSLRALNDLERIKILPGNCGTFWSTCYKTWTEFAPAFNVRIVRVSIVVKFLLGPVLHRIRRVSKGKEIGLIHFRGYSVLAAPKFGG